MEFCQKCGSVLVKDGKIFKCARCGYKTKEKIKIEASEKFNEKTKVGIMKEEETNVLPVTAAVCPKCGHREAYFWSSQTRAGDEAETRFFRCVKCQHTWREYR